MNYEKELVFTEYMYDTVLLYVRIFIAEYG